MAGVSSIADLGNNAFAGYYEIPYFMTNYFNVVANSSNRGIFDAISLYRSYYSTTSSNFENLFVTYDPSIGVGSEPPVSSLFNMVTFETLVNLGNTTPNILVQTNLVYGTDFTLDAEWSTLTSTLGL